MTFPLYATVHVYIYHKSLFTRYYKHTVIFNWSSCTKIDITHFLMYLDTLVILVRNEYQVVKIYSTGVSNQKESSNIRGETIDKVVNRGR